MPPVTRRRFAVVSLALYCLAVAALAQTTDKFPYKQTDMPFNAPPVARDFDGKCGDEGTADPKLVGQKEQNRQKNFFGAQGTPVPIQITDIDRLEQAAVSARNCWAKQGKNCRKLQLDTKSGLPVDRGQLKDIAKTASGVTVGEGTLVSLEAQVLSSHYSNSKYNLYRNGGQLAPGDGESVNCKHLPGLDSSLITSNDVHIVLVAPGVKDECMSVTAEISPHFRPKSWQRFHNMGVNELGLDINKKEPEAKGINFKQFEMVRITGPLFYDASHDPCSPGHHSSPARRSLWEIHPAYKLDVKVNGQWMSFDDWAKTH